MSYNPWTTAQEDALRANASLGARACKEVIKELFGVDRDVGAVSRHASRIGVSLAKFETCPECGAREQVLTIATGLCKACTMERKAQKELTLKDQMRRELLRRGEQSVRYQRVRRLYEAARRKNQRTAKEAKEAGKAN
jgi:hypothetical protein